MTVDLNIPYSSCELKRVKRLEFGVMHPDIIKKISVCEIVNVDLYKDGLPREGGLNDIRMGTIDYKLLCGTCNMNVKLCPGHFGHIILAKPMYHYGFMTYVANVLRCICFHCGRLLCDRNSAKVKRIEKIKSGKIRLRKLSEICASIRVCDHSTPTNEESININDTAVGNFYNSDLSNLHVNEQMVLSPNDGSSSMFEMANREDVDCGCIQPRYSREGPNMYIQFVHTNEEMGDDARRRLSAEEALEILKKIRKEEMGILGFDSDRCLPTSLILTVLAIPPPCARPYVQYGNQRSEDDLTLKLLDIVKTNIQLKRQTERGARLHVIQDLCSLLQFHITTLLDNDIPGMPVATTRGKKPIKAIRTRLKGKEGRLRGNLMGKRVDFSARTVITGDPNLGIDYIGVPKSVAMTLTFCETVTPLNIEDLKKCVERGPYEWPGAKYIIRDNGAKYDLRHVRKNSEKELEYGYKVERHMRDDDYILFNRQPSLHKMSIMGHKAKILPYSTFRLNLSVTSPYNADFDGDEMNLHLAQSHETRSEVKHLMIVQNQIVSPQGNKPVMGIVQDSLLAIRKFTRRDNFLTKEEVMSLLIWIPYWNHQMPVPAIMKPKELWTGKQLFSMLLQFESSEMDRIEEFIEGEDGLEEDEGEYEGEAAMSPTSIGGMGRIHSSAITPQMYGGSSMQPISSPLSISDGMLSPGGVNQTDEDGEKKKKLLEFRKRRRLRKKRRMRSKLVKINLIRDSSTPCKDDNPYCSANDGKVIIKNNELLSGIICKRTVGSSSGSLIHILWHELGPDKTKEFISALQKVTNNWLESVGFTVSCSDVIASDKILNKVREILNKSKKEVAKLVKQAQSGELECQPGKSLYESFETRVNNELNCAREMSGKASSESLDEKNNIYSMVVSGSKGSVINISQIISCVGQQNVEGKRIPFGFNQRTLPHFIKFDYGPESRGFVSNSYLSGLSPQEVFFHAMGGREGIIDTACKTSETGYIQRRLIKAMEDVMVQYDRTVRNSYGEIIQFLYGEDGMAGEYIEDQIVDLMKLDNKEISKLYKYNFDDEEDYETDLLLCRNDDDEKNVYIDYNKQNILNQEFEELKKCKNYLCKELFPDGDIRQHLPINMNRLIEFAKTQFPYIPSADKLGDTTAMRRVKVKGKRKKKKTTKKGKTQKKESKEECNGDVEFLSGMDEDSLNMNGDIKDGNSGLSSLQDKKSGAKGNEKGTYGFADGEGEGEEDDDEEDEDEEEEEEEYYLEIDNKLRPFSNGFKRKNEKDENGLLDPVEIVKKVNAFLDGLVIIKQANSNDTLSLEAQNNATTLLKAHLRTYLNSKLLNRTYKISAKGIDWLLEEIENIFYKSLCHSGECVGALAAQSIGEPATQMTLNTFHFAGVGSKNVTLGVPRLKELINVVKNVKTPSTTIYLDSLVSNDQQKAKDILTKLEYTTLKQLTSHAQVIYDPYTTTTILEEDRTWVNEFYEFPDEEDTEYTLGEWVLRIKLTNIQVNEKKLTMKEIVYIIYTFFSRDELDIIYTDDNSEDLILRIRLKNVNGEGNTLNDMEEEGMMMDNEEDLGDEYNTMHGAFGMQNVDSQINFEEPALNGMNGTMHIGRDNDLLYNKDKKLENASMDITSTNEKFPNNVSINRTLGEHGDGKHEKKGKGTSSFPMGDEEDDDNINDLFGGDDDDVHVGGFKAEGRNGDLEDAAKNVFGGFESSSRHEENERDRMRLEEEENNQFNMNNDGNPMEETDNQFQNRKNKNINRNVVPKEDTEDIFLKKLMEQCLATLKLRGINNITKVYMREEPKINYDVESGKFVRSSQWVLDTDGCNLQEIFCAALVDFKKTISNDIVEIFEVLGIEAVRRALLKELRTVISFDSSYVNYRHLSILCDIMTQRGSLMPITRHGINRGDRGPLLKCSFEETVDILLEAAAFAEVDHLKGVTENIMLGQLCRIGTGAFDIIIDNEKLIDANQNLEIIQDITSAGFTTPDTFQGITPEGLQSPIPVNTMNSPLPFSPTYNLNLLSPTAPLDGSGILGSDGNSAVSANLLLSPQSQSFADNLLSPTKNDFNNLDTTKLGGKFSPVQSPHSPQSPTSVIHSPLSPFDIKNQISADGNAYSPSGNYMNNVFSPKGNVSSNNNNNVQSFGVYSPNCVADIFSPKQQTMKSNIYSPSYSPTSPSYNVDNVFYSPTSPKNDNISDNAGAGSGGNVMSPRYSPTSPKYSPTSPKYSPTSPKYSPTSPKYSPTSPKYSPTSPQYSPTSPVSKNLTSPHYSPYSVSSPKFSPTSPAYSISSPVYDERQTALNNRPLQASYTLQSTQGKKNAQPSGMYTPAVQSSEDVSKDDPFSPKPYNIEEEADDEEEEEDKKGE